MNSREDWAKAGDMIQQGLRDGLATQASDALHPDWVSDDKWGTPGADFQEAVPGAYEWMTATPIPAKAEPFTIEDVKRVELYQATYHDSEPWKPGDSTGTELDMVVLGELNDGRWFSLLAWNDYTGWGCQDGADVHVGATREDVVRYGLTNTERERLGLS